MDDFSLVRDAFADNHAGIVPDQKPFEACDNRALICRVSDIVGRWTPPKPAAWDEMFFVRKTIEPLPGA